MRPAAFAVGVTGHRPNRLGISQAQVEQRCMDALTAIARGARGARLIAYSALAEGADRAFADAALTCRFELRAIVPFDARAYESTFSDPLGIEAYRKLLARAAQVEAFDGDLSRAQDAYDRVGRAIIAHSDLIVAVWDGAPRASRGGTPDVIATAVAQGKPVVWIDAHGMQARRALLPEHLTTTGLAPAAAELLGIERQQSVLDGVKGRAIALPRAKLVALADRLVQSIPETSQPSSTQPV